MTTRKLLRRLLVVSECPVMGTHSISSKGMYLNDTIFINANLDTDERLKVLLHELGHYVHLNHFYNEESRGECEIIANCIGLRLCHKYDLDPYTKKERELILSALESALENPAKNRYDTVEKCVKHIMRQINPA